MIWYIICFLPTMFFAYYSRRGYLRYKKRSTLVNLVDYYGYFLLALIPLTILGGIRYDVGTDYMFTYYPNFYKILAGEREYTEVGFYYLNKFIQVFSSNAQILFFITNFLFVFFLIRVNVKYSKNIRLSFVITFLSCIYFYSLNNVRQAISAVLILNALPYLVKRQFWKFLIIILLSCIFHYSALIFIPIYLIINWRVVKKYFLPIAFIMLIAMPALTNIAILILSHTKYVYFIESYFNNGNSNYVNILFTFILLFIAYLTLYKRRFKDKYAWVFLSIHLFAFLFSYSSLFIKVSEMISRLTFYFIIFQVVSIPYIIYKNKYLSNKIAIGFTYLLLYGFYFVYYILIKGYYGILPYQTIFG